MKSDIFDLYNSISPKYMVELIPQIEEAIWSLFEISKYKNVKRYINRWHQAEGTGYHDYDENFCIFYKDEERKEIDLSETLHHMPNDILIQIAIDVGVNTPGFLPSIPIFRNVLKDKNNNAFESFNRAVKNAYENPHDAISLANSTLEGIIKAILESERFPDIDYNDRDTLYDLTKKILKVLGLFPQKNPEIEEINKVGSGLLTACQNIESLRSAKTDAHGKSTNDYIVSDPLWAVFIVNSVASIGLLLVNLFEAKYLTPKTIVKKDEDVPF